MLKLNETPNLLELVEGDYSVRADKRFVPITDLSLCGDDLRHGIGLSVCADDELPPSDVRLKTDIEQVGTTVYGLPLFHFRYKSGPERFEGVMAQDVLQVMPEAVVLGDDGFYRVNYGRLGIRMSGI
jgi:hypothetical protein